MNNITVKDIRNCFFSLLNAKMYAADGNLEIINANFIADATVIFGVVDEKYVAKELDWYYSQDLNIKGIPGGAPVIWRKVADSDGFVNSNYGWAIFSEDNGNQYNNVLNELKTNPNSRRATMIYTRPNMWTDFNKNGRSDFMCTNAVQYKLVEGKLVAMVQMRSNDAVYGYKNDYAWQKHVHDKLAADLGVEVGTMYWYASSLHIYPKHFYLVKS